jgi:hypothetical protein
MSQALWVKVMKELPTLHKVPESEVMRLANRILTNEVTDHNRKVLRHGAERLTAWPWMTTSDEGENSVKGDITDRLHTEIDLLANNLLGSASVDLFNPEESAAAEEMRTDILRWASKQEEPLKLFITEAMDVSPMIEARWEEMKRAYPRYASFDQPPPTTLARMVGLNDKALREGLRCLRSYLISRGHLDR